MTTSLGLLLVGAGVLALVCAWTNRNPWDVFQNIVNPGHDVRPIDPS